MQRRTEAGVTQCWGVQIKRTLPEEPLPANSLTLLTFLWAISYSR